MTPPRLAARIARHRAWLALVAGAAAVPAFAPIGWYPLAVLSPALLFLLWEEASPRRAAGIGFAWGAGLFLAGTWWIFIAVHDYGKAPAWLAAFLMLALVAIMATYYALLGWCAARLTAPPWARWLVVLPAAWTLMEWLRGWLFSGFPWLQVGYAHSDSPLAAYAPLGGIHLVTLLSSLTAGAVIALLRGSPRQRLAVAAVALSVWAGGAALGGHDWTVPAGEEISVAIVQSAVPQDLKWQDDNRDEIMGLHRRMTRQSLGARLVILPEAALPVLAHQAGPWLARLWGEAQARGSDLMIGLLRYDEDSGRYYNGLLALSGDDASWYYKRRLVPFGEFFPVPKAVRSWMRLMSLTYVDMSPGEENQPPLRAAGQAVGATICYEDAYGAEQLAVLPSATLLVNVTNNAWFGDSAAPHQQLQMARFRALEAGRFLARATSNGVSGIIAPDGRVTARAPQFVPQVLRGTVRPYTGLTPYARTGNWPVLLLCALALAAALLARRPRRPAGSGAPPPERA